MHLLSAKTKAPHLVEDLVGGLRPSEGLALLVVCLDVREDGLAQLRHARVRSPLQGLLGEQSEEALHEVQPRRVRRREVQMEARMTEQTSDARPALCGPRGCPTPRGPRARARRSRRSRGGTPRNPARDAAACSAPGLRRWRRSAPQRGRASRCECSCASAVRAARDPSARSVARAAAPGSAISRRRRTPRHWSADSCTARRRPALCRRAADRARS